MLKTLLRPYHLILASGSPRRHQFFKDLELDFEVRLHPVKEVYPDHLQKEAITNYLADLKAQPFLQDISPKDIIVTSDTIVWLNNKAIGKPKDEADAINMLHNLSNNTHEVISSICVSTHEQRIIEHATTKVTFTALSDSEIRHYIDTHKPLDKAGAYGIQDWIGAIGISKIEGSYNNVVGLPTHLLYKTLIQLVGSNL